MRNKGMEYEQAQQQSIAFYTHAANLGHWVAQYQLAFMYDQGFGVTADNNKAMYWYEKSAEQGHWGTQNSLSGLYGQLPKEAPDYNNAYLWSAITIMNDNSAPTADRDNYAKQLTASELIAADVAVVRLYKKIEENRTNRLP